MGEFRQEVEVRGAIVRVGDLTVRARASWGAAVLRPYRKSGYAAGMV